MDTTTLALGLGMGAMASCAVSVGAYAYRDTLCKDYGVSFLCAPSTTAPPVQSVAAPAVTASTSPVPGAGGAGGGGPAGRTFSPYLMLTPSTVASIGKTSKWTTLAFVTGYASGTISWDAGAPSAASIKAKAAAATKAGGGVIVSFGGQTAGTGRGKRGFAELAGTYTDAAKLAAAYIAVADALGSTWLDFDVEGKALTDAKSVTVRAQALKLVQTKRSDIKVGFTVPVGLSGLDAGTKAMLSNVKSVGVRIDVVNLMTMYFTKTKTKMADACMKAAAAAKPFLDSLGAKMGITPQLGKNPDAPYTAENFTLADADALVAAAKKAGHVALLGFWEASKKDASGAYAKKFKTFEA